MDHVEIPIFENISDLDSTVDDIPIENGASIENMSKMYLFCNLKKKKW